MASISHQSASDFGMLNGTDGNDQITGGNGRDDINGSSGDDTILAKDGNDEISGGEGIDTVIFDYATTDVTAFESRPILGPESTPPYDLFVKIQGPNGTDSIDFVERYQFTDQTLTRQELEATFGHLGNTFVNDYFHPANFFTNTVDAGEGYDTVALDYLDWQLHAISENGQTIHVVTVSKNYALTNIEAIELDGQSYTVDQLKSTFSEHLLPAQTILGHAYDETLLGTSGDDILYAGTGVDLIDGKEGMDTIHFLFSSDQVDTYSNINNEVLMTRSAVKRPYDENTIKNVEFFKFTDETIHIDDLELHFSAFNTQDQTITGTNQNDRLSAGGLGSDHIDGLGGDDTAVFNVSSASLIHSEYTYQQNNGVVTITHKGTEVDQYKNIEAFEFKDKTIELADMDAAFIQINLNDQVFNTTAEDDEITGGIGSDTVILDIATTDVVTFTQTTQLYPDFSNGVPGFRAIYTTSINSKHGYDLFNDIDSFQFSDKTLSADALRSTFSSVDTSNPHEGTSGDDILNGGHTSDIFLTSGGNDFIDGKAGLNSVFFVDIFKQDVSAYQNESGEITITIKGTKTDKIVNVEFFRFADNEYADLLTISDLDAEFGHLPIPVQSQDNPDTNNPDTTPDEKEGGEGESSSNNLVAKFGEMISGGGDKNGVTVEFNASEISQIIRKLDNTVEISTDKGSVFLEDIENITFLNNVQQPLNDLILEKNAGRPVFNAVVNNEPVAVTPEVYTGLVDFLEYQLLGDSKGNIVTGSTFNDFLNLLDGDDAANGGDGNDVLDGGTGSNFLTGGQGGDTFFLDGRGGSVTWSTVTDFEADRVNIWGWQEGISQLLFTRENEGAEGFKGATFHFDLNNDGAIDTSITFSGLSVSEIPDQSAEIVSGNGYLLFA